MIEFSLDSSADQQFSCEIIGFGRGMIHFPSFGIHIASKIEFA